MSLDDVVHVGRELFVEINGEVARWHDYGVQRVCGLTGLDKSSLDAALYGGAAVLSVAAAALTDSVPSRYVACLPIASFNAYDCYRAATGVSKPLPATDASVPSRIESFFEAANAAIRLLGYPSFAYLGVVGGLISYDLYAAGLGSDGGALSTLAVGVAFPLRFAAQYSQFGNKGVQKNAAPAVAVSS